MEYSTSDLTADQATALMSLNASTINAKTELSLVNANGRTVITFKDISTEEYEFIIRMETFYTTKAFKWRTREGELLDPKNMRTSHLYYALVMIWNHTVPEEHKFKPFKEYEFSSFYSSAYMAAAVYALKSELRTRNDLTEFQVYRLNHMTKVARGALGVQ